MITSIATTPMAIQLISPLVLLGLGDTVSRKPATPHVSSSTTTGRTSAFQCGRSSRSMRSHSLRSRVGYPIVLFLSPLASRVTLGDHGCSVPCGAPSWHVAPTEIHGRPRLLMLSYPRRAADEPRRPRR